MGSSILEVVLELLREGGFAADAAYPGCRFAGITEPVAAAHIHRVDRSAMTVTVEVTIVSPAALGGTACELAALRATERLHWSGAACIQEGCQYDSVARVYSVRILATYTCQIWEDDCRMGPGFQVYAGEYALPYVVKFLAEREQRAVAQYEMGENGPVDIGLGSWIWKITIEEQFPPNISELVGVNQANQIRVLTNLRAEIYGGCRWTEETREFTSQGLRRTWHGVASRREEMPIE